MFALGLVAIIASFFVSMDSIFKGLLKFGLLGVGVYIVIISAVASIQGIIPSARVF